MLLNPPLHDLVNLSEVLSGVNAQDVVGLENVEGEHLATKRREQRGGVGEVVFALRVAGGQEVEGVGAAGGPEAA